MPEANYLLSVSWGYIKVCGVYLQSWSGLLIPFSDCAVLHHFNQRNVDDCFQAVQAEVHPETLPHAVKYDRMVF